MAGGGGRDWRVKERPKPLLSSATKPKELDDLWRETRETAGNPVRNPLVPEHRPLVRKVAMRLRSKLPSEVELDDLMQVGMLGLHRAMLAYDAGRGIKFATFAEYHVRGAILDDLRDGDWAPRLVRARTKVFQEAIAQLRQHLGRNPSEEELAGHLKMSPKAFLRLSEEARPVVQVSLGAAARGSEEVGEQVEAAA